MSLRSRQHPSARTSLLGYDVGTSSSSFVGGTSAEVHQGHAAGRADELLLQGHNDQKIGELERQVGAIKHITLEIESELQNSNRMLDEMNFTMDNTRALLECVWLVCTLLYCLMPSLILSLASMSSTMASRSKSCFQPQSFRAIESSKLAGQLSAIACLKSGS